MPNNSPREAGQSGRNTQANSGLKQQDTAKLQKNQQIQDSEKDKDDYFMQDAFEGDELSPIGIQDKNAGEDAAYIDNPIYSTIE